MIGRNHEECEGDRGVADGAGLFGRRSASIRRMQFVDAGEFLQHQERFTRAISSRGDGEYRNKFRARFYIPAKTGTISRFALAIQISRCFDC